MTSSVEIDGVPETMLWVLYNRAHEARRPDTLLHDPECLRVYESIDYDFERRFGRPQSGHPMRSRLFDDALRPWLATHLGGTVVELGAGLETQFQRCDDGRVRWLCVDVLRAWCPGLASVELASYGLPSRGIAGLAAGVVHRTPVLRGLVGTIVHVRV